MNNEKFSQNTVCVKNNEQCKQSASTTRPIAHN